MKITPEQKTKYSAFMQDLWGLIKEYGQPERSDEYWRDLRDKATEISKKHDNDTMVMNILVAFVDAVDKELEDKNDSTR